MKRLLYTLLIALTAAACTPRDRYITFTGFAQGGTYSVKLNLKGTDVRPEAIRDSVDAILVNIDNSLSGYNRKSLLSRFNAEEEIVPDSLFTDIYDRAVSIFEETDGVVDPASAPLFDLWGFGFTEGEMPSESTLRQVMSESGMGRLKADMAEALQDDGHLEGRELLLESAGDTAPELNYNAIAQGYSCDVVARYLYSIGVKDMLVDIGEFFCDGRNPSGKPRR